jgi:trehalose-6-phosphate synthase
MDREERIARWTRMMGVLRRTDISWWAETFLRDLSNPKATGRTRTQIRA